MRDTGRALAMGSSALQAEAGTMVTTLEDAKTRTCTSPRRLAFWREYLVTMRPYLLPVSGLAGLAGMSLARTADPWRWAIALLAFSLSYGFGQALTDCFQQDTDRLSAPYRPLIRGSVDTRHVLAVSLAGLVVGLAMLGWCNPWNLVVSGCAIAGLLAYTPAKRLWWAGPLVNASVVALLPVMGWLVERANSPAALMHHPEVLAVAAMTFAAYANVVLVGHLKDLRADWQAGYSTVPVVFGWRRSALASDVCAAAALLAGLWALMLTGDAAWPQSFLSVGALAAGALLTVRTQVMLHRTRREDEAYRPLLNAVRVFLVLHVAVIASARPSWSPLAAAFYAAFEFLVARRPQRRQI